MWEGAGEKDHPWAQYAKIDKAKKEARTARYANKIFGKWTTLNVPTSLDKNMHVMVLCRCKCGTERRVYWQDLCGGASVSCGCNRGIKYTTKYGGDGVLTEK